MFLDNYSSRAILRKSLTVANVWTTTIRAGGCAREQTIERRTDAMDSWCFLCAWRYQRLSFERFREKQNRAKRRVRVEDEEKTRSARTYTGFERLPPSTSSEPWTGSTGRRSRVVRVAEDSRTLTETSETHAASTITQIAPLRVMTFNK